MSQKKFVAIGHITNDLKPKKHLGGGVSYSAVTASRLGFDAHIITKCPQGHPYINELKSLGIKIHVLPSSLNVITTFDNQYDVQGKRRQIVTKIQEQISLKDKKNIPWNILKGSIILVAPVTSVDVDIKLLPDFARYGLVNVAPQGYLRKIAKDGAVTQRKWRDFTKYLSSAKAIVLSDEDISINGILDEKLKKEIITSAFLVALTQGLNGVTIYEKGQKIHQTRAFSLSQKELVDLTGAGDVFTTAFITEIMKNSGDIKAASVTACLFAAMKIAGVGGVGIDSIPTGKQTTEFLKKHSERIKTYLKSENSESSKLPLLMLK